MKEQSSDSQNSGNLKMEVQDMTENFREIIGLLKGFGVQKYFILKQIKSFLKEFMGAKSTIDILNTYAVLGAENQKKLLSFINMILKDEYGKVNVPCVIKFGEDVFGRTLARELADNVIMGYAEGKSLMTIISENQFGESPSEIRYSRLGMISEYVVKDMPGSPNLRQTLIDALRDALRQNIPPVVDAKGLLNMTNARERLVVKDKLSNKVIMSYHNMVTLFFGGHFRHTSNYEEVKLMMAEMLWPEDELIQKSSNNTELTSALVVVTQQRDDILTCLRGVISSHSIDKIPSNLLSKKLKESCDALSLYISAMIGNEQLAKDLSLEVFFNAWIDFKMSPGYSSFDDMVKLIHGWLIDYFKKGKKDIKKSSIINNIDPSLFKKLPDISVQDICDTMDSCVAPIVYGLGDAQWKAWTLHINGLPFDSAGQVIDSTYGAVASSFSLAKSHILEGLRLIVGEKMEITGLVKKNEIIEVSDVDPNAEIAIRKINEHLEYFNNNIFYKEYFPLIGNGTGLEGCFATAIKNGILSAAPDSLESLMSNIVRKLEMYCGEASHTPVQEFLSMGKYCDCLYKFLLQIKKVIPFPD